MLSLQRLKERLPRVLCLAMLVSCGPKVGPSSFVDDFQPRNITAFGLARTKILALTFDDGPSRHTAKLLDILQDCGVHATFFVLGDHARTYRAMLGRMLREGHIVANHTKTHEDLRRVTAQVAFDEIAYTHDKIKAFTGNHRLYFRAPYGSWKAGHAELLNGTPELKRYIGPIFWTAGGQTKIAENGEIITAADWECWDKHRGIPTCSQGYINETGQSEGGVVLMHDLTDNTVEMAAQLIDYWVREGYRFVTLDELQALDRYQAMSI
jgi:peptidoglycan/xylan/chitin deacetylase (PgdA/CDA1 family)